MRRLLAALAVCAALLPSRAWAVTYDICASGCDYTTIAACVAALGSGSICEIADSRSYDEQISDATTGLTIRGGAGHSPVMDSNGTRLYAFTYNGMGDGLVIENLTIREYTGYAGPAITGYTYRDVTIRNMPSTSTSQNGSGKTFVFDRVAVLDGGLAGVVVNAGTLTATNVLIAGNAASGFAVQGTGVATCNHCTIADNGTYGAVRSAGTLTVRWSVIYGNGTDTSGTMTQVENLVGADPAFIGAGDYGLAYGSAAIDATTTSTEAVDITNAARDATPDQGAYECVEPCAPPSSGGTLGSRVTNGTLGARVTGGVLGNRVE